jgi:DNA topoisomerase IB
MLSARLKQLIEENPTGKWVTMDTAKGPRPIFIHLDANKSLDDLKKAVTGEGKMITIKRKDRTIEQIKGYSTDHIVAAATYKFARVAFLARDMTKFRKDLNQEMEKDPPDHNAAVATCLSIMAATGMRPGSDEGETKGEPTYGASTILKEQVTVKGDTVRMVFKGKSGVDQDIVLKDKNIAAAVKRFLALKPKKGKLFTVNNRELTGSSMTKRMKKVNKHYKTKDLRTLKANEVASEVVETILKDKTKVPDDPKKRLGYLREIVTKVATAVSKQLGNTPKVAETDYISPDVFEYVLRKKGLDPKEGNVGAKRGVKMGESNLSDRLDGLIGGSSDFEKPFDERYAALISILGKDEVKKMVDAYASDEDDEDGEEDETT